MGRILIVDDDPFYREGIKRVAGRIHEVETAASGAEGLHMMRHNGPFAVVVSDLKMAGMSGIDFLARAREIAPETIRIMLTGYMSRDVLEASISKAKVAHFLEKPLATDDFLECLASYAAPHEHKAGTWRGDGTGSPHVSGRHRVGPDIWNGATSVGLDLDINADILATPTRSAAFGQRFFAEEPITDTEEKDDER